MFIKTNNPIDLLPQSEAETLVRKVEEVLCRCWTETWQEWMDLSVQNASFRANLDSTARAAILSAKMRARLKKEFADRASEGFRITEINRMFLLSVDGKVQIRFKKFSIGLKSRNIKTFQQADFEFQRTLAGLPDATHLTCGYVLDDLETAIAQLVVTCRMGSHLVYRIDLAVPQTVSVFQPAAPEAVELDLPVVVRPRGASKDASQKDNSAQP